jgi:hypothetical protein
MKAGKNWRIALELPRYVSTIGKGFVMGTGDGDGCAKNTASRISKLGYRRRRPAMAGTSHDAIIM